MAALSAPVASADPLHEGVASCAGSTCHGRPVASGLVVRQNEISTWQDPSSPAGAHSRAWRVLTEPRAQAIAARLGLGPPQQAPECLACHADFVPASQRGPTFQISDGVGCEACHGGSRGWLASHYAVGAGHADNVVRGMLALENPKVRAAVCLDCHFGSAKPNQVANHRLMSAGHPRLSFELDLFSELERHWDVNAGYAQRKAVAGGVKTWAVGQAMALERALTLYGDPKLGQEGVFPEFAFFDCHSCHRPISDDPNARPTFVVNPGRPIPSGMAPFNDENLILLSAAAREAAPQLAARYEADVRAFHLGLARDRPSAVRAAARLAETTRALQAAFAAKSFSKAETFAILDEILGRMLSPRFTDYAGAAQAVMAVDTLLNALAADGQIDRAALAGIRPDLERAYKAVSDPRTFHPDVFRAALERVASAVGRSR
jgi:hypothetical protein